MAAEFLIYGDSPKYSRPLYSWPQYGRVGGPPSVVVPDTVAPPKKGGVVSKFTVPDRTRNKLERDEMLMKDDSDLLDIVILMLENNILD